MYKNLKFFMGLILLFYYINVNQSQPAERKPKYDPNHYQPSENPCYDDQGIAQRCVPDFINAAFNLEVEVTNTCGERQPTRFCVQSGHMGMKKLCDICDSRVQAFAHPSSYLTDFSIPNNETWWQSETMLEGIQYPNRVNLTLRLGKTFDITYVRLKFVSPRPESFRIYKKSHIDDDWIPWVFYSGSCKSTYKLPEKAPILPGNEAIAQCTREFSDISPLRGGNIAFSTLEGRPSAENFEESEVLQEWVTATEIRIVLDRMNTFGDEIFGDPRVLRSYYYAISDFAVGGRCKCNGHASQCVKSTGGGEHQLVCDCKHHTTGVDCQTCEPFYVDRPWRPATSTDANECSMCQCNGLTTRCFFDKELFETTGHGGHCIDCAENTKGPHCENCVLNYWRPPNSRGCIPCQCDVIGSFDGQCDKNGQCRCKPGVSGQFCNKCKDGFYDFSASGCQDCRCELSGSYNNTPFCQSTNGNCACKFNVEGQRCDKCKPGYFDLSQDNNFGCTPCFCYGHSSVCFSADGYYATNYSSNFFEGREDWTAGSNVRHEDVQWSQIDQAIAISQFDDNPVYFYAPAKYLGDQRFIYNQDIVFTLRVQQNNPSLSKKDIVIVGANNNELYIPIFGQSNPSPSTNNQIYHFRIHSNPQYQWSPSLREIDFISILSNITAIKIRGTYSKKDVAFLSKFTIGSASLIPHENVDTLSIKPVKWVETCKCTEGFVGQFCESCASGYKREHKFGGPLTKCIKCDCNRHSNSCDAESGVCICQHNTAGDTCERCKRGYFGDALNGTETDCQKCNCPNNGPCVLLQNGDTICTECPEGYTGRKCENCGDEYFGNPLQGKECKKCECNGNTDLNSIGNCDTITGECKKCIYNTIGFNCEKCAPGFWGDALAELKNDCKSCNCYVPGTVRTLTDYNFLECNQRDGQCSCLPNVIGLRCDQCETGYFNLTSGSGCQECNCDFLGSINKTCDVNSGQCQCKPGVVGRRCDQCALRHYGYNVKGCNKCDCDIIGSETLDCDVKTGQCLCKDNVEGRQCNQCSENRYNLQQGCLACDDCYTLIQTQKNKINESISTLRDNLNEIVNNPVTVNDNEFDEKVVKVKDGVQELFENTIQKLTGDDSKMRLKVNDLKMQLKDADRLIKSVDDRLHKIDIKSSQIEINIKELNAGQTNIQLELKSAILHIENEGVKQLSNAQKMADRYGDKSQQLTDLAEQASLLSNKQETHKKEIKLLAENARNASKTALIEANEAIFGVTSTSQQITNLYNQATEIELHLNKTKELADEQNINSLKLYDESAKMLSNVESIKLPLINPDDLKIKAKHVKNKTTDSLKNIQIEVKDSEKILLYVKERATKTLNKFVNLKLKQQDANRSLKIIERYNNQASEAFDLATKIWNEAKDSHDSLSDFNEKIQNSKEEAIKQLKTLPNIEKDLSEVKNSTIEAEEAIENSNQNANQNANEAKNIAYEAKLRVANLIQESEKIYNISNQINHEVQLQKNSINNLFSFFDSLTTTTKDFDNQAMLDAEKSQKTLRKATIAENSAKNLQNKLIIAEKSLFDALDQLNSLENVDDNQLAELKELLEGSEKQYEKSENEDQLQEKIRKAEEEAGREKRQIEALKKDLENLQNIRDSLPSTCYNLVNLEQEGQKKRKK